MRKIRCGIILGVVAAMFATAWQHTRDVGITEVSAQQSCTPPPPDPPGPRRTAGATVTLRIHDAFTLSERASIIQAFNNWNDNKVTNCTNVTFDTVNVQYLSSQPPDTPNWQWVEYVPSTEGDTGISWINGGQFGRIYLSGRIKFCPQLSARRS